MPKIENDDLEQFAVPASRYGFSATKIDNLGATEYTLVTICVDESLSVGSFKKDSSIHGYNNSHKLKLNTSLMYDRISNNLISVDTSIQNKLIINKFDKMLKIKEYQIDTVVDDYVVSNNCLYIKNGENMFIVEYHNSMDRFSLTKVGNVMPRSTEFYAGCLLQKMLGSLFLTYYDNKNSYLVEITDKLNTIVSMRKIKDYLSIIDLDSSGNYFVYLFHIENNELKKVYSKEVQSNDINFTVNSRNVGFLILDDEDGIIFNKSAVKEIQTRELSMDMRLFSSNDNMYFHKVNEVYTIKLNSKK